MESLEVEELELNDQELQSSPEYLASFKRMDTLNYIIYIYIISNSNYIRIVETNSIFAKDIYFSRNTVYKNLSKYYFRRLKVP